MTGRFISEDTMSAAAPIGPGFNYTEAMTLLELSQQNYIETPGEPASTTMGVPPVPNPPDHWQLRSDLTPATTTVLDNFWKVWQNSANPKQFAVSVRGTVGTSPSILTDVLLPLLPARMQIGAAEFHFARAEPGSPVTAGVHAGFSLSTILMLATTDKPLLKTLKRIAEEPEAELYITGHSQGASIALLLSSYLLHCPVFARLKTKTYVYAPSKPGNDHYACDLDQGLSVKGLCFSVMNTQDWVPQSALTLQGLMAMNQPNPIHQFNGTANPEVPFLLRKLIDLTDDAGKAVETGLRHFLRRIRHVIADESLHLLDRDGNVTPAASVELNDFADSMMSKVLPSLNYAKAGAIVPVFGVPGGNPDDGGSQFDFFWQHHLGHYYEYLKAQYGPQE